MRIALAGNPNVGKSTVFNALTGMNQHTGNWIGKTVGNTLGYYIKDKSVEIYDLPGTYSLSSSSKEEEVARDFLCFENIDACVVICDALSLERNFNLLLQIMELNRNVVLCVNMLDEAKKNGIDVNLEKLSDILNIPVVGVIAKKGIGIDKIIDSVSFENNSYLDIDYGYDINCAVSMVSPLLSGYDINNRWLALKLICNDVSFNRSLNDRYPLLFKDKILNEKIKEAREYLYSVGIGVEDLGDIIVSTILDKCHEVVDSCVCFNNKDFYKKNSKVDRILTNKVTGIPIMFIGLLLIFWITIVGSNYPSSLLFTFFNWLGGFLVAFLNFLHLPAILISLLCDGVYKVLTWVVSVMLPPMAIFFPLFTLLEDVGFLPRLAFNLDNSFRKCSACGKQGLTMAMGFGCNAVGVTGSRIIDSPRERLLAILTNVFVPCNGRFPTIILLISMFFVGSRYSSILSSLFLTLFILLSILVTFIVSYILSITLLKGEQSSFILELPPYRRPVILKTIIRSIVDRTFIILKKAIKISSLAGVIIWVLANVSFDGVSILNMMANFFNSFGELIGLDGAIIVGFILGFPANEIVFPIIVMIYMSSNNLASLPSIDVLRSLLIDNGFGLKTAICMIIFCLFHFPCSTTCLTIYDETKSFKWTILGFVIPTIVGIILCFGVNFILG